MLNSEYLTGMVSYSFTLLVQVGDGRSDFGGYPNLNAVSQSMFHDAKTLTDPFLAGGNEVIRMRMAAIDAPEVRNQRKTDIPGSHPNRR